jgi:hypothetical protein
LWGDLQSLSPSLAQKTKGTPILLDELRNARVVELVLTKGLLVLLTGATNSENAEGSVRGFRVALTLLPDSGYLYSLGPNTDRVFGLDNSTGNSADRDSPTSSGSSSPASTPPTSNPTSPRRIGMSRSPHSPPAIHLNSTSSPQKQHLTVRRFFSFSRNDLV